MAPNTEPPVANAPPSQDVSLLDLAAILLRYWWLVLACALAVGLVTAGVALSKPRVYTSSAAFLPQTRRVPSGVAGLAAQFGVDVSSGDAGQTPQFYVDLLSSRDALEAMVDERYAASRGDARRAGTLVDVLGAPGTTPALRREAAIAMLRDMVEVSSSPKTNVVTFLVHSGDPDLSQAIAARGIVYVNRFNVETRQSQARAEREFTERRLNESAGRLRDAENRLRDFELSNRAYSAPALSLERQRLQRDLDTQQRLYSAFSDAFERARLDEIRDTPVITVVSVPRPPVRPDGRGLVTRTVLGFIGGAVLGLLIAVVREAWRARPGASRAGTFDPERMAPGAAPALAPDFRGGAVAAQALEPYRSGA